MTLSDYLTAYLGDFGTEIGLSASSFTFMAAETLEKYGVSDEASVTDAVKLHAIAKVVAWETVLTRTAGDIDYRTDGESFSRSQAHAMAKENLAQVLPDAMQYLPNYSIVMGSLPIGGDPYNRSNLLGEM